eukprot:4440098-Karenia_brevis.AAC.1
MVAMTVKQVMSEIVPHLLKTQQGTTKTVDDKKGKLEEKYFRRIDKFSGEPNQFRTCMFNIKVSLGQVDHRLAEEVNKIFSREDRKRFPMDWDPARDEHIDKAIYDKYHTELYGVL